MDTPENNDDWVKPSISEIKEMLNSKNNFGELDDYEDYTPDDSILFDDKPKRGRGRPRKNVDSKNLSQDNVLLQNLKKEEHSYNSILDKDTQKSTPKEAEVLDKESLDPGSSKFISTDQVTNLPLSDNLKIKNAMTDQVATTEGLLFTPLSSLFIDETNNDNSLPQSESQKFFIGSLDSNIEQEDTPIINSTFNLSLGELFPDPKLEIESLTSTTYNYQDNISNSAPLSSESNGEVEYSDQVTPTTNDYESMVLDYDRLWPIVDQVSHAGAADVEIQKIAQNLQLSRDPNLDNLQKDNLKDSIKYKISSNGISINQEDFEIILDMVYDEILGISVLGILWRDDDVTEIMVDRWDKISVEKNGKLLLTNLRFRDNNHAKAVARNLALRISDRALSSSIPLVTAELPDARVTFAFGSVVKGGISITLRKFRRLFTLDELLKRNSLSFKMSEFLKIAVKSRAGILVSGGTGTGKTTIINLLSSFIPDNERVVTIEDAFELNIDAQHVVSLQTKEASSRDDEIKVTLADLLINTLRMRPDRIIVGEIREGDGANVMLQAANTGHDGTMTTIHASSSELALNERLVDLVREVRKSPDDAIKRTIVAAFDLVIQVSRGRKGQRFLSQISLVDRTYLKDGSIKPLDLFTGEEGSSGEIIFKQVNKIPLNSELYVKMINAGVNMREW